LPHRGDRSRPRGQLRGGDQRGRDIVRSVSTRNPDRVPSAVPRESFSPPERYSFPAPQPTGWPIQWRAARPTGTLGPSPQTHFDVSRLQVAVTEPSAYDWEGARSPGGRERSVRRANLTLPDADHRAPEIRHQASAEAPAARKAAELQATLTEIRAELGRMAAHVTENPRSTAIAATVPAARLEMRPAEPVSQPAEPATPAEKPPGRPRQFRAMRLAVLAMAIPILFGLIAATTELALHGYGYFVFRSAGTGATQQGPSEPPPSQPSAAHHRRHAGPSHDGPPCASLPGSETARAIRTNKRQPWPSQ